MTLTFATNANNDLYLGADGNIAMLTGVDAVMLICEQAVRAYLGEMVYAQDQGVAYFETVFNGSPNVNQFEASARAAILAVDGVVQIKSFVPKVQSNVLSYSAVIQTIYGEGALNV